MAEHCTSVICCRVTPLQKALVVELIKGWVHNTTILNLNLKKATKVRLTRRLGAVLTLGFLNSIPFSP